MNQIVPTVQTQQIYIRDEKTAVQVIEQAKYNIQANFLKIAEYLHFIEERELFLEWGYKSIFEFIESNPKLDFERRTAEMLLRIWRKFGPNSKMPIPLKILAEIGYSKSYQLTRLREEGILNDANKDEWIEKAKNMTVREFIKEVNKALGKEEEEKDNWVTFSFRVPPDAMDEINEAIYFIAKLDNIPSEEIRKKRGELLARIIEDWKSYFSPIIYNEELTDEEKAAAKLLKIKEQIEATYPGVQVILPKEEEPDF